MECKRINNTMSIKTTLIISVNSTIIIRKISFEESSIAGAISHKSASARTFNEKFKTSVHKFSMKLQQINKNAINNENQGKEIDHRVQARLIKVGKDKDKRMEKRIYTIRDKILEECKIAETKKNEENEKNHQNLETDREVNQVNIDPSKPAIFEKPSIVLNNGSDERIKCKAKILAVAKLTHYNIEVREKMLKNERKHLEEEKNRLDQDQMKINDEKRQNAEWMEEKLKEWDAIMDEKEGNLEEVSDNISPEPNNCSWEILADAYVEATSADQPLQNAGDDTISSEEELQNVYGETSSSNQESQNACGGASSSGHGSQNAAGETSFSNQEINYTGGGTYYEDQYPVLQWLNNPKNHLPLYSMKKKPKKLSFVEWEQERTTRVKRSRHVKIMGLNWRIWAHEEMLQNLFWEHLGVNTTIETVFKVGQGIIARLATPYQKSEVLRKSFYMMAFGISVRNDFTNREREVYGWLRDEAARLRTMGNHVKLFHLRIIINGCEWAWSDCEGDLLPNHWE